MKTKAFIPVALILIPLLTASCSVQKPTIKDVGTGSSMASLAGAPPTAGFVGLAGNAAQLSIFVKDYLSGMDKPKVTVSPRILEIRKKATVGSVFDKEHKFVKRADYATVYEDGQLKRIPVKDIPRNLLNTNEASLRAHILIPRGFLTDEDPEDTDQALLKRNLDTWKNGGLVVIEYHGYFWTTPEEERTKAKQLRKGPEGATVIAVSEKHGPFEIMLPEEWEARKADLLKSEVKTSGKEGVQTLPPADSKTPPAATAPQK